MAYLLRKDLFQQSLLLVLQLAHFALRKDCGGHVHLVTPQEAVKAVTWVTPLGVRSHREVTPGRR